MPDPPRRRRLTLALLLGVVAVSALLLAVAAPLVRQGAPICVSDPGMALQVVRRPWASNCTVCHVRVGFADHVRTFLPATTAAAEVPPPSPFPFGGVFDAR